MRVTQELYYRNALRDLLNMRFEQVSIGKQIDTGHKVNLPSDAPAYSVTILDSRHLMAQVSQYRANLESAANLMTASEENMNSIKDLLVRAKTIAEQMATGTIQTGQHVATASEVQNIIEELIKVANTRVEGDYIFSGSRTKSPAISSALQADNPAELTIDSSTGSGAVARLYQDPITGLYHLEMTRDTVGANATVSFPVANTLGVSTGFNFNPGGWTQVQMATSSQAEVQRTNNSVAGPGSNISTVVGEELTWLADPAVGNQTYRTDGTITVTGAGSVRVNGVVYAFVNAADLANQLNQAASPNFFAHVSGNDVRVISKGTGSFNIDLPVGPVTINDNTTLQELQTDINNGEAATAMFNIDGGAGAFPPLATDTVTIGTYTWTWQEIANGAALVTAQDYANALRDWVNAHTYEYQAAVSSTGGGADATVMLTARAVGDAANGVSLGSSNAAVTHSGQFYGGFEGTDTATTGRLYATGTSTLRLGTTIRGTVMEVASDGTVTVRLEWYDDDGVLQTQDLSLPAAGENNSVAINGTGGLSLYRNDLDFYEGAVFHLEVGHYRGNDENLSVNFAEGGRLIHNWNAEQILGGLQSINLLGAQATPNASTVNGGLYLAGTYRGLRDREITFDVVSGGSVPGGSVKFKVTFLDDEGQQHVETISLSGAGRENAVVLPINGVRPKVDLTGQTATPNPANTGDDVLHLDGTYRGLTDRNFTFTVTAVSGNQVTFNVTWVNDQGVTRSESLTTTAYGSDHKVELPSGDGVSFYLTQGTTPLAVGDSFTYNIKMHPANAGDGIFFYIDNQTFNTGESFYYKIDQNSVHVMDALNQWRYTLANGTAEEAQTQSQKTLEALDVAIKNILDYISEAGSRKNRITTRRQVLDDHKLYAAENLKNLQDVDVTEAYLQLRANQTAYNASLKTISTISELFLANLL